MFRVDQPIQSCSEDDLGRESFANAIAEAILHYDSKDSIVLGLFGPWGSGKTSILNCVREYIAKSSESLPDNKKPVLMVFNPWTYSDQNQLIAHFFKQISVELKTSKFVERAGQIGTILDQFSVIFQPVLQVAQLAEPNAALAGVGFRAVGAIGKWLSRLKQSRLKDAEELKKELDELLGKLQNKIIVMIDDVDRLNHFEIRQVFQLVKKLADFKNTVYLLAFDKNVVLKALGKVQEGIGEQYLEKIVTVPFDIPNPGPWARRTLLEKGLEEITGEKQITEILDSYYGEKFLSLFRNLRDVNRYLNTFRFAWGLIKYDINLKDLMIITAIQVRYPRLYDAIRERQAIFTLGHEVTWSILVGDDEKWKQEKEAAANLLEKTLEETCDISSDSLKVLLLWLFPPLEEIYSKANYGPEDRRLWRREKQICSSACFDRYFALSVPSFQISQREINEVLSRATSLSEFSGQLKLLEDRGLYMAFISWLRDVDTGQLEARKIKTVLMTLMNSDHVWGGVGAVFRAIENLARGLTTFKERFQAISDAIYECKDSLYTMVWTIGLEHDWHSKHELPHDTARLNPEYVLIRPDHLEEIERTGSNKILAWAKEGRLIDHPKLAEVLLLWHPWAGRDELSACMEILTHTDECLIKFVSAFFEDAEGKDKSDIFVKSCVGNMQKFVNLKLLEKRIKNMKQPRKFDSLNVPAKLGIEAIIEWYSSSQWQ